MKIKIFERDIPGHFCRSDDCEYFQHTDISTSSREENTIYCVSSIGALPAQPPYSHYTCVAKLGKIYEKINIDSIYEIMVFDKTSNSPWREINSFRSDNLSKIKRKHKKLVTKYKNIAEQEKTE